MACLNVSECGFIRIRLAKLNRERSGLRCCLERTAAKSTAQAARGLRFLSEPFEETDVDS